MSTKSTKLSALLILCFTTIALPQDQDHPARATSRGLTLGEIKNYREMIRVNQKPIDMVEETKLMCAPPAMMYGPHYDPGVVYYINDITSQGIKTFSEKKLFPVGSIIVKEKQERRTEDSVGIITVMKKVLLGDSEDSWEYKMYDTRIWSEVDSSKPSSHPFNKTCIECHRRYKQNDYVSDKGIALLLRR